MIPRKVCPRVTLNKLIHLFFNRKLTRLHGASSSSLKPSGAGVKVVVDAAGRWCTDAHHPPFLAARFRMIRSLALAPALSGSTGRAPAPACLPATDTRGVTRAHV